MAEHHARQCLDLEVPQRRALRQRKAADLRLRELDVGLDAGGQLAHAGIDLGRAQPERGRAPAVELLRVLAHGGVATRGDVGDDALHRAAHLGLLLGLLRRRLAGLQVADHPCSYSSEPLSAPSMSARINGIGGPPYDRNLSWNARRSVLGSAPGWSLSWRAAQSARNLTIISLPSV